MQRASVFSFFFIFLIMALGSASAQYMKPGDTGKTYYDSSYTQICEIFHHDVRYLFYKDTVNHVNKLKEILIIKNGPYVSYYPNGNIESSGFFINNERDSTWLFYKPDGAFIRQEKYREGLKIE